MSKKDPSFICLQAYFWPQLIYGLQVDPTTAEMLKAMNLTATVNIVTIQQAGPPKPAFQGGDRRGKQ